MQALGMAGHLIRRLHQHSTQIFTARLRDQGFDITPVQFAAMDALSAKPGLGQARIAALIAYDRATIGAVIDRLASKGLVERAVSKEDRRTKVVCLTDEGQRIYRALLPVVQDLQNEILGYLAPSERPRFLSLASKAIGDNSE